MKRMLPILIIILLIPFTACSERFWNDYPTYPTGGEYDGGGGGGTYYPPYDYDDDYYNAAREAEGTWEGFLWEDSRSDGRPLGKQPVAVRISYAGTNQVKVNVVVDGRPVANEKTSISSSGRIGIGTNMCSMSGYFSGSSASGSMTVDWDEKYENPYNGKVETHHVVIRGSYSLNRSHGGQWAAVWDLFNLYEDDIWNLPDEVWEEASREGLEHLAEVESTYLRMRAD